MFSTSVSFMILLASATFQDVKSQEEDNYHKYNKSKLSKHIDT